MNGVLATLGLIAGGVIGFLLGNKKSQPPSLQPGGVTDAAFIRTRPGTDGFCEGKILKRMKGRGFHWRRVGGCTPAPGSRFEIRLKNPSGNPLIPAIPYGVDDIWADVQSGEPAGNVYKYSLYQVLANGSERELHDPELEIGQI